MNLEKVVYTGKEPEIVAIHGFGGCAQDFALMAEVLPNCISALQLPFVHGHVDYSTDALVQTLNGAIKPQSIVLGYSMGARLLLQWAVRAPQKCGPKALIVISGTPGLRHEALRSERRKQDAAIVSRIEKEGVASFFDWWREVPIISSQKRIPEPHQSKMKQNRLKYDAAVLSASLHQFGQGQMPPCWDALNSITCPVLLIAGETDQKYRQIAEQMKSNLSNAHLAVVSEAGHCPHLEQSERTGTIIQKWFDRHGLWG